MQERGFCTTRSVHAGAAPRTHERRSRKRASERGAEEKVVVRKITYSGALDDVSTTRIRKIADYGASRDGGDEGLIRKIGGFGALHATQDSASMIRIRKIEDGDALHATKDSASTTRVRKISHSDTTKDSALPPRKPTSPAPRRHQSNTGPKQRSPSTSTTASPQLPRLLRQISGDVPPRAAHERANGEQKRDFEKLEGFLWKQYYRVVSGVRRAARGLPVPAGAKPKTSTESTKHEKTAVRKVRIHVDTAQRFGDSLALCSRHVAMLAAQISQLTGLDTKHQQSAPRTAQQLVRTGAPPTRTRRSHARRSPARPRPADTSPALYALYLDAGRLIRRTQLLAARTRALLPTAPVPLASHASRTPPRSASSRGATLPTPAPRSASSAQRQNRRRPKRQLLLRGSYRYVVDVRRRRARGPALPRTKAQKLVDDVASWLGA